MLAYMAAPLEKRLGPWRQTMPIKSLKDWSLYPLELLQDPLQLRQVPLEPSPDFTDKVEDTHLGRLVSEMRGD